MKKPCEIVLIQRDNASTDAYGNPIEDKKEKTIFAYVSSIGQGEFYQAATQGFKPELQFEIYLEEYEDETELKYNDVEYSILRTYQKSMDILELKCERKISNGRLK